MLETYDLLSGTVLHAAGGPPWDALPAVTLPQNLTWNDNGIAGARQVRSGISFVGISGFKVVRGWKFEGSFEGTSSGSNRFYIAGLNIGARFGDPAIMSQNESSGLSLGTNVIDDEFPAVSYPLTGLAPGSVSDLSWPGFVLSMWGLSGSGTKSVTIPDGYLTTAELYVSDPPMLAFLEQPLDPVAAGGSFTVRIRAYYTADNESVVGGYFMCAPSGFSGVTVVGDSLKQTDANGEIEWTFAVAEDSPTAEGSVIIMPAPYNSDVLPGSYVPRSDMPLYGYQTDMFTSYSIAVSVEGGGTVPEGCFWDGIVNAVEDCGTGGGGENVVDITGVFDNGYGYEIYVWVGGEPGWCGATPDFYDGSWQLLRVFVDNSGDPLPECGELDLAGMPIVEISEPTYAEYNGGGIWFWNVGTMLDAEGVENGDRVIIEVYNDSVGISYYWVTHFHVSA